MTSLIVGAAVAGFVGAFLHASTWRVSAIDLPVGLALALAALAALLLAVRQTAQSRVGVAIIAAGWLLPVVVLSLGRSEGDIVVASNLAGLSFVLVGVVLIGIAVGWSVPNPNLVSRQKAACGSPEPNLPIE